MAGSGHAPQAQHMAESIEQIATPTTKEHIFHLEFAYKLIYTVA